MKIKPQARVVGVALIAIFIFSVSVATSASATTVFLLAEWLVNGAAVTSNLASTEEGELLLEDTKTLVGKAMVLCSGIFDGTVGANGAGTITELLSLTGKAISLTALSGEFLTCTNQENCEKPELWAVHLPWAIELNLIEIGGVSFFGPLITKGTGGNAGYYLVCTVLGVKAEDECTTEVNVSEAKNIAAGVESVFSDKFEEEAGLRLATCTQSREETAIVEGPTIEKTTEAGTTLSVSSTG